MRVPGDGIRIAERSLLLCPEEDPPAGVPELFKRLVVIEDVLGSIGKQRAIPDIGIPAVEHSRLLAQIVGETGGSFVVSVVLKQITGLPNAADLVRQDLGGEHRRKGNKSGL